MANLTFTEKQLIESVFGMASGYIINFTNREFEAFMNTVVSYNIYEKYPGLSKAKMFREFLKDESETYVGKAILTLLNYMKENDLIPVNEKSKSEKLYELGGRLLGKNVRNNAAQSKEENNDKERTIDFDGLNAALLNLEQITNTQTRGYAFEGYLNDLFRTFGLDPRASYRTQYDQIDGSFVLGGNTVLVEAKYRAKPIPKDDLILFSTKIGSKSHFARGVFITYSLVDNMAIEYFADSSARFIVVTVEELFIMCQRRISLLEVLQSKFRLLDEKGVIYGHIMNLI